MTYTPTTDLTNQQVPEQPLGGSTVAPSTAMHVRKRHGGYETADVMKIVRAVERSSGGLENVDPLRVATRTISGLYDGATTQELDELSIRTAASLIAEEPEYSRLAARLLNVYIDKEVKLPDDYKPMWIKSNSPTYRHCLKYLKSRGVSQDDMIKYSIGYCEDGLYSNRVIIPSYDEEGKLNLLETAPGVTVEEVISLTEANLTIDTNIKEMSL